MRGMILAANSMFLLSDSQSLSSASFSHRVIVNSLPVLPWISPRQLLNPFYCFRIGITES